jgi:hypothetical protein
VDVTPVVAGHGEGSVANDGVPRHAKSPAAKIYAAALLVIVIWQSPRWPVPSPKRDLKPCPHRGKKKESSRNAPRNARKQSLRMASILAGFACKIRLESTLRRPHAKRAATRPTASRTAALRKRRKVERQTIITVS